MGLAAERLIDWRAARAVGARVAGHGQSLQAMERARIAEDFARLVPQAESMVELYTGLSPNGYRSRAWVMSRSEWLSANLRGFEVVLEPFARKILAKHSRGALAQLRRGVVGAQLGALLGYMGRRVLGQYDMFLPPDDDGLIYFVGANVVGVERRFRFPEREFRLWIAVHEVTHRLQFGGAPWLRNYLSGQLAAYLDSVDLDPAWLLENIRRAVREVRTGNAPRDGLGWMFLLMTPDQRTIVRRIQAAMSLLEGHASFVMNSVSRDHIPHAPTFHRRLRERRRATGMDKAVQRAIGFEAKVRQYESGERFVSSVVGSVGTGGFNRIWGSPAHLPTLEEIGRPGDWVARIVPS